MVFSGPRHQSISETKKGLTHSEMIELKIFHFLSSSHHNHIYQYVESRKNDSSCTAREANIAQAVELFVDWNSYNRRVKDVNSEFIGSKKKTHVSEIHFLK
jgi:hypothetical protein